MSRFLGQLGWVARRSVVRTLRQPEAMAPSFVFPLILLALISAGMHRFAEAPGFPAESYLDFALGGALVQAALVGAVTSGASLAGDVESGFLARLALTPVARSVLLFGHFAGTAVLAGIAGVVYLTIGRLLGVEIHTGVLGAVVVVGLAILVALAFGAICAALALLTGSSEAIQGMFPLFFTLLSISTFFTPKAFIGAGWFRRVANANPVSYLIDGVRSLIITGWDAAAIARAVGVSATIALVATTGAVAALHYRLEVR